jgi:hypothetical protein
MAAAAQRVGWWQAGVLLRTAASRQGLASLPLTAAVLPPQPLRQLLLAWRSQQVALRLRCWQALLRRAAQWAALSSPVRCWQAVLRRWAALRGLLLSPASS